MWFEGGGVMPDWIWPAVAGAAVLLFWWHASRWLVRFLAVLMVIALVRKEMGRDHGKRTGGKG